MKQRLRINAWAGMALLGWLGCMLSTWANAQDAQSALDFDGTDDLVNTQVLISGSYTKEALVFLRDQGAEAPAPNNNIVSGDSTTANTAFWIPTSNGRRLAAGHDGQFTTVQDTAVFPAGRWMHVAVTYNANGRVLTLYKNGVQVDQATGVLSDAYMAEGGDSLLIGSYTNGFFLNGALDEVRIWNYPRTVEEIRNNISQPLMGNENGLLAYYSFNQGTPGGDNTAIDSLNNDAATGKNGILSGFTLTGNTSNFVTSDAYAADLLPPAGYTVAIDQQTINADNQAALSFTITGTGGASTYFYTITNHADTVSGSGNVATDTQQVTGVDVSTLSDGELVLSVILADEAGNTGEPARATVIKEGQGPSATITSTTDSIANESPFPLTISFSEPVSGLTAEDFQIQNGSLTDLATTDSVVFTANVTPAAEGEVTVILPAEVVTDAQGTPNTEATFAILYDLSALTVTLTTEAGEIFSQELLDVTITFSAPVSGFALSDLTIANGTADTLVTADSTIFTLSITPLEAGPVTVEVPAGVATDANSSDNGAATLTRTYQPTSEADLTVSVSTATTSPTNVAPIPFTITFSQAVTGFEEGDVSVQNATLEGLTTTDSMTFEAAAIPDGDTTISVSVPENSASNIAGTANSASDTVEVVFDGTAPTASATVEQPDYEAGTFVINVVFSEAVSSFAVSGISVEGASVTGLQTSDSTTFTADATVTSEDIDVLIVTIAEGAATDRAGNEVAAADFSFPYETPVTGIEDLFVREATLKLFPVPTSQYLHVTFQLKAVAAVDLELGSIDGHLLMQKALGRTHIVEETISIGQLSNGIYVLRLFVDGNRVDKKIVIDR